MLRLVDLERRDRRFVHYGRGFQRHWMGSVIVQQRPPSPETPPAIGRGWADLNNSTIALSWPVYFQGGFLRGNCSTVRLIEKEHWRTVRTVRVLANSHEQSRTVTSNSPSALSHVPFLVSTLKHLALVL